MAHVTSLEIIVVGDKNFKSLHFIIKVYGDFSESIINTKISSWW